MKSNLVDISSSKIGAVVQAPYSKSYINRALILAAINPRPVQIENITYSRDVQDLVSCLKTIGLEIREEENCISVVNSFPACELESIVPIAVYTGDGGTTTRFMMALLALGSNAYHVYPSAQMLKRPIVELISALDDLQISTLCQSDFYSIQGPLKKNEISVDCSKTTQVASALMLIGLEVQVKGLTSSALYIEMTKELIASHQNSTRIKAPIDFSGLSYIAAYATLNQDVLVSNCFELDSNQSDSSILEIINTSGGRAEFTDGGLRIYKAKSLNEFDLN
ncbi:MAG: hypothetical protein KDC90_19280, partial [Ignavibacteriae bacterium]|nr:hypothetical protein [Ignavibacteriota bacterium]